jgi:RHS repeat-associated protein
VFGNYVDEVLTMTRASGTYFYHQNTLWSPHAITDATGTVVERYSYDGYGKVTVTDGLGVAIADNAWGTPHSAAGNRITFTGRELDEEIGLYFYRARIYDCAKGRFLSRDPLGYWSGINYYEYVYGRPTFYGDPSGLLPNVVELKFEGLNLDIWPPTLEVKAYAEVQGSRYTNCGSESDTTTYFFNGELKIAPEGLTAKLGEINLAVVVTQEISRPPCSTTWLEIVGTISFTGVFRFEYRKQQIPATGCAQGSPCCNQGQAPNPPAPSPKIFLLRNTYEFTSTT